MTAVGLATAASPFLIGQQAAGAAVTLDRDERTVEFITNDNLLMRCELALSATHNTNDRDAPYLDARTGADGTATCLDGVVNLSASYKDQDGMERGFSAEGLGISSHVVGRGAYTATTVTATFGFFNCDQSRSTCVHTLTASPK